MFEDKTTLKEIKNAKKSFENWNRRVCDHSFHYSHGESRLTTHFLYIILRKGAVSP